MIVTDDEELAGRCRMLRNLCFREDVRYVHDEISDNYRFTNLQAAVGLAQLERLDEFVRKKRQMGRYYTERLSDITGLILPIEKTDYADNIYWVYGIYWIRMLAQIIRQCRNFWRRKASGREHFSGVCMNSQCIVRWDYLQMKLIRMQNIWQEKDFIYQAEWHLNKLRWKWLWTK